MTDRCILLVDAHVDSRRVYETVLRHGGHRVLQAGSGAEALRLAAESLPDVVVTEVWVPGVDGLTLMERLRSDPRTAGIPVLLVSASGATDERRRASEGGAAYLTKPCSPTRLAAAVETLLDGEPVSA